jgi:2-amino-4-hydroxy-6-hydroxymethyldihydropteridine diphosphokinase
MNANKEPQKQHLIYLGMGTNAGDRLANLQAAVDGLAPQVEVLAISRVYQTPPWGYTEQADFLNIALKAITGLNPEELLVFLKDLESRVGRTATFHWGPREIDIDILFYDDLILEQSGLTIPHPMLHKRAFVLIPLTDLDENLEHPNLDQTIRQLVNEVDTEGVTEYVHQLRLPQEEE